MSLNPIAAVFWIFCACVGYLINGSYTAVLGATIGIAVSMLASFMDW